MLRSLPPGFVAPCLPTKADTLPSGPLWLHEIKHDGFGVIARKDGDRVRLYSRPGNNLTGRFPLILEAHFAKKLFFAVPASVLASFDTASRLIFRMSVVSATAQIKRSPRTLRLE